MGSKGDGTQKAFRAKVVGWIERYTLQYYAINVVIIMCMIPLAIYVFPSTTLMLTVFVLTSALLGAMGDFSSLLVDLHQNDEIDQAQDDLVDLADDGKLNDS